MRITDEFDEIMFLPFKTVAKLKDSINKNISINWHLGTSQEQIEALVNKSSLFGITQYTNLNSRRVGTAFRLLEDVYYIDDKQHNSYSQRINVLILGSDRDGWDIYLRAKYILITTYKYELKLYNKDGLMKCSEYNIFSGVLADKNSDIHGGTWVETGETGLDGSMKEYTTIEIKHIHGSKPIDTLVSNFRRVDKIKISCKNQIRQSILSNIGLIKSCSIETKSEARLFSRCTVKSAYLNVVGRQFDVDELRNYGNNIRVAYCNGSALTDALKKYDLKLSSYNKYEIIPSKLDIDK